MRFLIMLCAAALAFPAMADDDDKNKWTVTMNEVTAQGVGDAVGEVTIEEVDDGLVFTPDLKGLPPGMHGFHVHEHASCDAKDGTPAGAAGGHYDPKKTGNHGTPWGDGHRGDLPALYVAEDGTATYPVFAPRLDDDDLEQGRALIVHEGGDNHADHPQPLGGGGARLFCGVIK